MDRTYVNIQNHVELDGVVLASKKRPKAGKNDVFANRAKRVMASDENCLCRKNKAMDWAFMSSNRYSWWRTILNVHANKQARQKVACSWGDLQTNESSTNGLPVCGAQLETATSAWCWLQEWAQRTNGNAMGNMATMGYKTGRKQGWQCWEWCDFAQDLLETLQESHLVCLRWQMVGTRVPDTQFANEHFMLSASETAADAMAQQPVQIVVLPDDLLPKHVSVVWLFFDKRQGDLCVCDEGAQVDLQTADMQTDIQGRQLLVDRLFLRVNTAVLGHGQADRQKNARESEQVAEQMIEYAPDAQSHRKPYKQTQVQQIPHAQQIQMQEANHV